jgi:NTE family protein
MTTRSVTCDLPRVGLALGGGGARGLAHITVIEVVEELGLPIACIAGTSIGAIIGWGMASGLSGRQMREIVLNTFLDGREVAARVWTMRPKGWGGLRNIGTQLDAEAVLTAFLPDGLARTFDDLTLPLAVVTTDYYGWQSHMVTSGEVKPAVAASIAIPFVFKPVLFEGRIHVDGGVVNPLPTGALGACDLVIGVDVIGGPVPPNAGEGSTAPTQMESILGATQLCMQTITKAHLEQHPPDVLITPPITNFQALNFLKAREVLSAADGERDAIKRQLSEGVEAFLRR